MSDLISRSELIMCLSDYALQESPNDNESTGEQRISKMIYDAIQNCISCVEEQPTAYDIDKVIAKLEELDVKSITRYKNGNFGDFDGIEYYIKKREAIEIVKQGGVSEDVCEWSADKIKVTSLEVIVTGSKIKPYYEIKYKEVGTDNYNIGYSSYNLDSVFDWKEKCFELVKVVE